MDTKNQERAVVGIEIYQAKPISFQVNTERDFNENLNIEDLNILMQAEFGINSKDAKVGVEIKVRVTTIKDDIQLFELLSFFEFGVFELSDVVAVKGGKERLDSEFARKLLNIGIGGTRGMLSIYLASTPYKQFTLPIANLPDELFTI